MSLSPKKDLNAPGSDTNSSLPDVGLNHRPLVAGVLHQVGMRKIEMPIRWKSESGETIVLPALMDAFVSLDEKNAKGIHMSRLYLQLRDHFSQEMFSLSGLKELLQQFLATHSELSKNSFIQINFDLPLKRKALLSSEYGMRHYPIQIKAANKSGQFSVEVGAEIMYSSTCPCSAALARQLVKEKFEKDFSGAPSVPKDMFVEWLQKESSIVAVPHAQRSRAWVEVKLGDVHFAPALTEIIDLVELSLGTPVQSAVKRQDEQEFARLNGANLMFCEDAARKLRAALEKEARFEDYRIKVEHEESLHPHNAVAVVVKGIEQGFSV